MLTTEEIEAFVSDVQDAIHNFKIRHLQEQVAPLVGKTMKIERTLKDPITGDKARVDLTATVTGARWTYEDGISLKVTYVHPFTGKVVDSEADA